MQIDMLYGHTVSAIIEDYIYLSDLNTPLDINILRALGITHIINASNEAVPNKFPDDFSYYNVNIEDNGEEDILEYFDGVYKFLCPDAADDKPHPSVDMSDVDDDFVLIDKKRGKSVDETVACVVDEIIENVLFVGSSLEITDAEEKLPASDSGTKDTPLHNVDELVDPVSAEGGEDVMLQSVDKEPAAPVLAPAAAYRSPGVEAEERSVTSPLATPQDTPRDKTILFHCRLGVSRSATLVVAFLMRSEGKTLKEAFELTKSKRPKVCPTDIFANALIEYEQRVFPERKGDCSVSGVTALTGFRASSYSMSSAGGYGSPRPSLAPSAAGFSRKTETIDEDETTGASFSSHKDSDKQPLREEDDESGGGACHCCCVVS
jgi:hypothetical protein